MVTDHLNQLTVTLDGPGVGEDGVAVDDLTAVLTGVLGGYTRLVFDSALSLDMQRLATQFVEVRGSGRFNADDDWASVHVEGISGTPSGREPFDLDAVVNDPNPKLFDPDRMVTASEPFVVRQAHHERGRLAMNGGRVWGAPRAEDPSPVSGEDAGACLSPRRGEEGTGLVGGRGAWFDTASFDRLRAGPSAGSGQARHERGAAPSASSGRGLRQAQDRLAMNGG